MKRLKALFHTEKPIIGMVHLLPLPGSPRYEAGGMEKVFERAEEESLILEEAGVDGLQVENIWDLPYCKPDRIGPETVAGITAVAGVIVRKVKIPVGVNCHINGVCHALAIAEAIGAKWVRAFELANTYISNSGIIEAAGPEALRYRTHIKGDNIMIFGDFHVKHGSHYILSDRSLTEQAHDVETCGGDAVIVTGVKTGSAPTAEDLHQIKKIVSVPVLVGSGLSSTNLESLFPLSDGAIVGSGFKKDGKWQNRVDFQQASDFMRKVRSLRGNS
jgi:membrane complex biogenesis BtpA family protein